MALMQMRFEELDDTTREYMLREFDAEMTGSMPYMSRGLTTAGTNSYIEAMRDAIRSGHELQLAAALTSDDFWHPMEVYVRDGVERPRRVNVRQAAERLAITEFNTWYVRGLSKRFLDEGYEYCQVYRAAEPKWQPADCSSHENMVLLVADVYAGHRARYWPPPGDLTKVSVPFNPGCHHTIRRHVP